MSWSILIKKQGYTYLSVDQGNADHVIVKQHAALAPESVQLLFEEKRRRAAFILSSQFEYKTKRPLY